MQQDRDITVVVTSCNRHDLLARTLESFLDHETERRVARIIVAEDGDADPGKVSARFGAESFRTGERIGQIRLIDKAYGQVTTPYIFHLEDDWEFYRSGFMELSRVHLAERLALLVWIRAWRDTNGHPLSYVAPSRRFGTMATDFGGVWHGFTFNPGLRRLADYQLLGSYAGQLLTVPFVPLTPTSAMPYEAEAGKFYRDRGYWAVILDEGGYVRHIGDERHVAHSDDVNATLANLPSSLICPCGSGKEYRDCHGKPK